MEDRPLKYTRASQKCRGLDFFGEFQELSVDLKYYNIVSCDMLSNKILSLIYHKYHKYTFILVGGLWGVNAVYCTVK